MSVAELSVLLPLPEEELQQVLDYAASLSKAEAASHFSNLLGDTPQANAFISSFTSKRKDPTSTGASSTASASASPSQPAASDHLDAAPKTKRTQKKKKPALHTPEARRVDEVAAPTGTTYNKKTEDLDYIPQRQRSSAPTSNAVSRSNTPKPPAKERPSAGFLVSDSLDKSKSKAKSNPTSRSSTPKPAGGSTKISITGGTPMAGQSTAISDLDGAIRALEITTNPTLDDPRARTCNCVATRHPLQGAAPNCMSCGKVICMKEGLGPCTFCGTPLLSSDEVQAMMKELREERGRERMAIDAKSNRRADVSKTPAPFTQPRGTSGGSSNSTDAGKLAEAEAKAREHRDKLLGFQAQNARRTTVRDEAADFDITGAMAGTGSMWASPEDRARELKRQQKVMREMEWNARPEYEKRQQVVSIDLVGGKVVKRMAAKERPASPVEDDQDDGGAALNSGGALAETSGNKGGGVFSKNPLLGSMIKPVFEVKGKEVVKDERAPRERKTMWRRVQDDRDDNEGVILDGGVYGHSAAGDEPDCG